jgi:hypothetical protein
MDRKASVGKVCLTIMAGVALWLVPDRGSTVPLALEGNKPAVKQGYQIEYVPSNSVALVAELVGRARVRAQHAAAFRELREGDSLYRGDTIFVYGGGHVILEEISGGTQQLVYIPELTTYNVRREPAISDLVIRTLLPDPKTVEERLENYRTSQSPKQILASPLGRFDVISLSSLNENWIPEVTDIRTHSGNEGAVEFRDYARMTALAVLDLTWLEVKTPLGDVFVYRGADGRFPSVDVHLASKTTGSVLLTVWKDSPPPSPLLSRALPLGTNSFRWQPPAEGAYTIQILSLQDSARSRVLRVYAQELDGPNGLVPINIRPGDTVIVPLQAKPQDATLPNTTPF